MQAFIVVPEVSPYAPAQGYIRASDRSILRVARSGRSGTDLKKSGDSRLARKGRQAIFYRARGLSRAGLRPEWVLPRFIFFLIAFLLFPFCLPATIIMVLV
jgi:hypothetical protein